MCITESQTQEAKKHIHNHKQFTVWCVLFLGFIVYFFWTPILYYIKGNFQTRTLDTENTGNNICHSCLHWWRNHSLPSGNILAGITSENPYVFIQQILISASWKQALFCVLDHPLTKQIIPSVSLHFIIIFKTKKLNIINKQSI